jgi:hypothetical protein
VLHATHAFPERRAYSPVLRSADLPDTTIPWWGNRRLRYEFAEK